DLLLPRLLAHDQILLQSVEIAQQEVCREHGANVADIVVETDNVDQPAGFELVGELRQKRELDRIVQIAIADAAYGVCETEPLICIERAIAPVVKILHGELMTHDRRLQS